MLAHKKVRLDKFYDVAMASLEESFCFLEEFAFSSHWVFFASLVDCEGFPGIQ
jgi:hypothetical protein